jgi:hypothetical protein
MIQVQHQGQQQQGNTGRNAAGGTVATPEMPPATRHYLQGGNTLVNSTTHYQTSHPTSDTPWEFD